MKTTFINKSYSFMHENQCKNFLFTIFLSSMWFLWAISSPTNWAKRPRVKTALGPARLRYSRLKKSYRRKKFLYKANFTLILGKNKQLSFIQVVLILILNLPYLIWFGATFLNICLGLNPTVLGIHPKPKCSRKFSGINFHSVGGLP